MIIPKYPQMGARHPDLGWRPHTTRLGKKVKSSGVKLTLRDRRTGLYYAASNRWVPYPAGALDVQTLERAAELTVIENLPEMEIVVSHRTCDLVMPIKPLS